MKTVFLSLLAATAALILTAVTIGAVKYPTQVGCDFTFRANELKCLVTGTDPFDVWHGDVVKKPFYPFSNPPPQAEENGFTRPLNAYPPYAYTFAAPLGLLPDGIARPLYLLLMLACVGIIFVFGLSFARKALPDDKAAFLATSLSYVLLTFAFVSNVQSWNYPIPLMAALLAMTWCLDRHHDVLAGFCWSLVMIKPQTGLIFAVPLLLRKKFLTCGIAAATCLLASLPPAFLCGKSPITLCLESVAGSSGLFLGCGTFPNVLCALTGHAAGAYVGLLVGAVAAVLLTRRLADDANWFIYLMPAAFVSTVWSYAQLYCSVFAWPFFLVLSVSLLRDPRDRRLWVLLAGAALFCSRPYTFYHGLSMLFPETLGYSMDLHGHLDSLCSLVSLIVFTRYVIIYGACQKR